MRVPERQLLGAMRRAERVVDIQDLYPARLHGRADLIEKGHSERPKNNVQFVEAKSMRSKLTVLPLFFLKWPLLWRTACPRRNSSAFAKS
jgi:hypothetical protein